MTVRPWRSPPPQRPLAVDARGGRCASDLALLLFLGEGSVVCLIAGYLLFHTAVAAAGPLLGRVTHDAADSAVRTSVLSLLSLATGAGAALGSTLAPHALPMWDGTVLWCGIALVLVGAHVRIREPLARGFESRPVGKGSMSAR